MLLSEQAYYSDLQEEDKIGIVSVQLFLEPGLWQLQQGLAQGLLPHLSQLTLCTAQSEGPLRSPLSRSLQDSGKGPPVLASPVLTWASAKQLPL